MKAITIWQPWASLLAIGAKQYETRSWKTDYRGQIAIHAAAKRPPKQGELATENFDAITKAIALNLGHWRFDWDNIPLGCVILTAELVDCYKITKRLTFAENEKTISIQEISVQEQLFGDWTPGRYAWELSNVKMLPEPIPAKGQQKIWNWEGI